MALTWDAQEKWVSSNALMIIEFNSNSIKGTMPCRGHIFLSEPAGISAMVLISLFKIQEYE